MTKYEEDEIMELFAQEKCPEDCQYLYKCSQAHPYGMGTATEIYYECRITSKQNATDCPAYNK